MILLIAGHGGKNPGAAAMGYVERELTRKAVGMIADELDRLGMDFTVYDTSRDAYEDYKAGTLRNRAVFTEKDYLLEVHFDATAKDFSGDGKTTGSSVFYPSAGEKSGMEDALQEAVGQFGIKKRGAKVGKFGVINTAWRSGCPANLLEMCFIDDRDDMNIWDAKQEEMCKAIAHALADKYGRKTEMTEERVREIVAEMLRGAETKVSNALKDEWETAIEKGITDGTRPGGYATRAQVAAMVIRATEG